ncbi:hypothetical protein CEP10_08540 [Cylindrospermopsis raciborskii S07]|uniref:Uncharacterized protein n=1 Tax=Cylindrospermopsis raciborskii CS-505 TaxID=533240 RepID=A0A853MD62_9CYAN|nr:MULTISPECIES: hypothetical protein [Cylindrospermopsis]MBU6344741.1 hypothetical protein [Cyanobacteria bacterium REEB494]EFA69711.1 conserved hypothetical protein [Cylindrospermopsis raciborskii CS-505]KRH95986.1 hypothetical protein ASL19_08690 [Cylindrospermopsis sp. CR12]MCH4902961.1 hypothetical protein [Cylindrospermopsis raciborskii CHAB3438]MEB3146493.1 hypothetical protein [Cylindrospermopsis raciborskii]
MLNQKEMNSITQVDELAEILTAARRMQQEWLEYGVNYVHLYVEDVEGDWLEKWGENEEVAQENVLLDQIKEFLVSNDEIAVKIRHSLRDRPLFELAVDLTAYLGVDSGEEKVSVLKDILSNYLDLCNLDLIDLASRLIVDVLPIYQSTY